MKKTWLTVAAVAAFALVGHGVEVSTVDELTAALKGAESEIVLLKSGSPYTITAQIDVTRAVTIRGETGDPADVTIDAKSACRVFSINHAEAVVEGVRIYRGKLSDNGAGVAIGANGGTLRNCLVESCKCGASNKKGPGIYMNSANALVTGCQVRNCGTDGFNGNYECHGVYIDNGTLDHTLVVGCKNTNAYRDGKKGTAAVYLAKGTVKNCTIVGNEVSHYGLYCADANTCHVIDTISWDNVSLRGVDANCPNVNDYGANADVVNLCLDNPMFANTTDYALAPNSPCIGAGTDGCDLGWKAYVASVPAIGVTVSASKGTAPLEVTVELAANVPAASVVWEGVEASGTSFTTKLGGGNHRIKATATLAGGGTLTAENVVEVTYPAGEYEVSDVETLEWMLSSPLADGVVIKLADGNYPLTANCYALRSGVKVVGTSRENTVLSKAKGATGRFFYMNHKDAELDNLTVTGGSAGCSAGGIWIDTNGGTVSNCAVTACKTGASQAGGGVWMNSVHALVTHSRIADNVVGQSTYCGGVLLSKGTLANSLIVGNTALYYDRTQVLGAGVYMDTATEDAKVVNCTIAKNKGYQASGLYRKANAGYVINTIIFDNECKDHNVDDNFVSVDSGTERPTATAVQSCCSTVTLGTDPQKISEAPYDLATYELVPEKAGACIDKGKDDDAIGATDYFGNVRVFGKSVDIGANECTSTTVALGIYAADKTGVDSRELTLRATVQGAELEDGSYTWYLNGSETPAGEGSVFTKTFTTGKYSVRLVAEINGQTYEKLEPDFLSIYSSHAYVDANSTVAPVWPYPESAPATNLNDAVTNAFIGGVTLHIAAGDYQMFSTISLDADMRIVGAGRDATCIWRKRDGENNIRILQMNGAGAYAEGICVSNGYSQASGVYISGAGGEFADGKIVNCRGTPNLEGGSAYLAGANAKIVRSVITGASYPYDDQASRTGQQGGAVFVNGGVLESSLIISNSANRAGGVYIESGTVRNCTIVGNRATIAGFAGGIIAGGGTVVNCIVWDNVGADWTAFDAGGAASSYSYNCIPDALGTPCVTADPQFKDAANGDYSIVASSPCAYAGLWDEWMVGATDFFGNPRTSPRKKVSIGYCQAPNQGLMMLVR